VCRRAVTIQQTRFSTRERTSENGYQPSDIPVAALISVMA
jgi:hypothetical protein